LKVLDLFCGCGGLSHGLEKAGFEIALGIDNWEDALRTFKTNHHNSDVYCHDLSIIDYNLVKTKFLPNGVDMIVGGPPCQGFSISGKRDPNDPRNQLYSSFVRAVEFFKPTAFIMENVPNLASMNNGKIKETILNEFKAIGYSLEYKTVLASDYGIPQNRRRFILIGLRNGKKFSFPNQTNKDKKITCFEAISDLPELSVLDGSPYATAPESEYQKLMRENSNFIHNHTITQHSDKTISTIALVPDGGNYKDLPESLRNTRKVNIAWTRFSSIKPSFTIDTGHRHHFHYKYNRVPTVRESARLQSFPDNFIFLCSKTSQYKQVGNAVPPILGKMLGLAIKKAL
jgi:DNA (cytosine-5)-methyltransferase 1